MKHKIIVNTVTGIRFFLTAVSMYLISQKGEWTAGICAVTLIIYASDLLDGRLARRWNAATRRGAQFDVAADSVYIIALTAQLEYRQIIPGWFLFLIIEKLLEFLITSKYISNRSVSGNRFIFDLPGRITAVIFYLLPLAALLLTEFLKEQSTDLITGICLVTAFLSGTASVLRIRSCFDPEEKKLLTVSDK